MEQLLAAFFLFSFLSYAPVHAATIVDVKEESTFTSREQLNSCEWIDHFEVLTTTTYQETVSGFLPRVALYVEPLAPMVGKWNPCSAEYANANGDLPGYCPTERLPEPTLAPLVMGFSLTQAEYADPIVKEWSEIRISTTAVRRNDCKPEDPDPTCDDPDGPVAPIQTATPEPASWLFALTGLTGMLLFRRKKK